MANTQTRRANANSRSSDTSSTAIAAPQRSRSLFGALRRPIRSQEESKPRGSRLTTFWKALIITSFVINIVLLAVVLLLVGFIVQWRQQITSTAILGQGFAADNVAELRSVVAGLQGATIRTTIPLDQPLPLKGAGVIVPVDQQTTVTLVEPV
ncbi:MAG: hypothetical protein ACUVWS_17920, partial [Roseiflexus sp.]